MTRLRLVLLSCRGRDLEGKEVLSTPTGVVADLRDLPSGSQIASRVSCRLSIGIPDHCAALRTTHENWRPFDPLPRCPFSFDFPYAAERDPNWKPPKQVREALSELVASTQNRSDH